MMILAKCVAICLFFTDAVMAWRKYRKGEKLDAMVWAAIMCMAANS